MSFLTVENLTVRFGRRAKIAVDDLSFSCEADERVGIIGASGSGKSVTALAIMGLLPETATVTGSVKLAGQELVGLPERKYRALRGEVLSMIFQEPMTALDPTMRSGRQVAEAIALHHRGSGIRELALEWLERVGISEPARVAESYPHQLSGGQRQRVLIAMALANQPSLVICDEPTTALDVIVQHHILDLLGTQLAGRAALFVSHDLAVVNQVCDRVLVLNSGKLVESGPISQVLNEPQQPYTAGLIAASRLWEQPKGAPLPTMQLSQEV